jgi:hypothetical protein
MEGENVPMMSAILDFLAHSLADLLFNIHTIIFLAGCGLGFTLGWMVFG